MEEVIGERYADEMRKKKWRRREDFNDYAIYIEDLRQTLQESKAEEKELSE